MHSSMLRTMRSPTVATDMMRITQIGTYSPKLCYGLYLDPPGDDAHSSTLSYHCSRIHWPPTADRDPKEKYELGARLYGLANFLFPVMLFPLTEMMVRALQFWFTNAHSRC